LRLPPRQETLPIPPRHTPDHWQQRYLHKDLPWDTGEVSPELIDVVQDLPPATADRALEIGCGTGTDAIWLARQGFETLGVDIAPRAIELARAKARESAVANAGFEVGDIVKKLPVEDGSCAFAFDRGCFHAVGDDERPAFSERVFEALRPGGHWLTLCGNADEQRPEGAHGPPQLSARDIVNVVEKRFSILSLQPSHFRDSGDTSHLSWLCLMRKRA
jgi:SAM-dependent methyltransferase